MTDYLTQIGDPRLVVPFKNIPSTAEQPDTQTCFRSRFSQARILVDRYTEFTAMPTVQDS